MTTKLTSIPSLVLATCALSATAIAQDKSVEKELRRQLKERDAEISSLKQQLERLRAQQGVATPATGSAQRSQASSSRPASEGNAARAQRNGSARESTASAQIEDDDELSSALESSLVRQGGAVLQPGRIEIEPELSYFYDDSNDLRRDAFGTAVTLRYGLQGAMQADAHIPYVIRDRLSGFGHSSGVSDVRLGLTKQLVQDREGRPALLVFGRWRIPTGDDDRTPPTGFGQHAVQLGLTATKRRDPVLLFGSLSYTANIGSARLNDGTRIEAGNVFGARVGANLAATPDTSFFWGVSYNSSSADRFDGERLELTDRARGFVEFGSTTVLGRGRFFNLGIGLGVTEASPRFSVTASVPFRF